MRLKTVPALCLCLIAFLFCGHPRAWSQTAAARSTPILPGPNFSGTWYGSFEMTAPDGKVSHDTAVLVIVQDGTKITGTAGGSIDRQDPLTGGVVDGTTLRFHQDFAGGVEFHLQATQGRLEGTATGAHVNAKLNLRPAVGLLPAAQLTREITDADKQMFAAFEACDAQRFARFLSEGVEFYQDRIGLRGYEGVLTSFRQRCAEGIQLRRELVEGSHIVNSVPGFGAIEAGVHRFYSKNPDGTEHLDATARFTTLWSKESGTWKIVREVSYDHR
jgi:ketosteroid isomerase-like protein